MPTLFPWPPSPSFPRPLFTSTPVSLSPYLVFLLFLYFFYAFLSTFILLWVLVCFSTFVFVCFLPFVQLFLPSPVSSLAFLTSPPHMFLLISISSLPSSFPSFRFSYISFPISSPSFHLCPLPSYLLIPSSLIPYSHHFILSFHFLRSPRTLLLLIFIGARVLILRGRWDSRIEVQE